ncbi:hypothetical protein [Silvanigrella sp.]|jgi:hypothetical protein|uniref:hypothetical protein n=1 Tax=Silvanigrella sp. TaxID=2024976 RepID=UPI0037C64E80
MRQSSAPSFICPVPREPVILCPNSIVIEDDGIEYLVGKTAQLDAPESARAIGGSLATPQYRRLLKAIVAMSLGAGEHNVALALAVAQNWIDKFRDKAGSIKLTKENTELLKETLKEIKFRKGSSDSPIQICKVNFAIEPTVYFETQAVTFCIPNALKTYALWQIGHGDKQQAVLLDGRPATNALQRVEGLSGAIKRFAKNTGLTEAEAIKAWQLGTRPESDEMNGKRVDCTNEKKKAAKEYFSTSVSKLLNSMQDYRERVRNIVLSGGAAKDEIAVETLKNEVESTGWYKLHVINNLPKKDDRCEDPVFVCAHGLASAPFLQQHEGIKLGLDVGNFALKSVTIGE